MIEEVTNECVAAVPDGHMLAEHYEALRREAVGAGEYHVSVRGLALLMRRGVAAWMKCVSEIPTHAVSPATAPAVMKLPGTLGQNLIEIMATMAFATAMEVCDESRDSFESATAAPEEKRLSVRAAILATTGVREQRKHEASV
jgi:hypothetical protein